MPISSNTIESKLGKDQAVSRIYVAYSGGIDSHVLLHLCASIEHIKDRITAVYINHGLQKEAESWGLHCEQISAGLGVKFVSLCAEVTTKPRESLEEAARNARYAALKPLLAKDDLLLLAQHSEDQLETVLLQLFRGSGLKGLSGMPESLPFGKGKLVRPLLDTDKASIIEYAKSHSLKWIEDPSNQQSHFDRNFLRNDIIPLLKQRWPSLDKTVSRSAKHCADAQILIEPLAEEWLYATMDQTTNTLNTSRLQAYSWTQQQLIIRQWFKLLGLLMPSRAVVERILKEIVAARTDALPVFSAQGHSVRRYREKLFCLKLPQNPAEDNLSWPSNASSIKVGHDEVYEIVPDISGIPVRQWQGAKITVAFRSGGETIQLPGRNGHHHLKNLYQEAGIPPWDRARMPLIYLDDKLAVIGEHWISAEFYCDTKEPCFRIIRHKINPKGNDEAPDVD